MTDKAPDLFEIALALYNAQQFSIAAAAFERVLNALDLEPSPESKEAEIKRLECLEYLGLSLAQCGQNFASIEAFKRGDALLSGEVLGPLDGLDYTRALFSLNIGGALLQSGNTPDGIVAFEKAWAILFEERFSNQDEFDRDRASLAMNLGIAFRLEGRLTRSIKTFEIAQEIYDTSSIAGLEEHDGGRARLLMNLGAAYDELGRQAVAIDCYKRAQELFDGPSLVNQTRLDGDRAMTAWNLGNAYDESGQTLNAFQSYLLAIDLYEGPSLVDRSELDEDRVGLCINLGVTFFYAGMIEKSVSAFSNAQNLLETGDLSTRRDLDFQRADLARNLGKSLAKANKKQASISSFQNSQEFYDRDSLARRGDLDFRRMQLLLDVSELGLISMLEHADSWLRDASSRAADLVRDLPPEDVLPWSGMRSDFGLLHSNLLSWCLEDASRFEMIPEVLSAVQGRELAASIAEQLAAAEGLDPDGPLARFIDARAELRKMLERMHRMAGTGMGGNGLGGRMMTPGGFSDGPNPALEQLSKEYEERRRGLQLLREEAAKEPGFAALGAAQEAIRLETLQAVLDADEQLLLLFSHGESGHALLIGPEGAPEHLALPDMPAMVQQYKRLEKTLIGRGAVRRNMSAEPEADDVERLSDAEYASFWSGQDAVLKRSLWDPLADKLVQGGTLLVASAGDLHNLSLEPGKPAGIGLMTRLPGLAFFALSRGLYGNTLTTAPAEAGVAILADDEARDIPLVRREGELAARFWQEAGAAPDYPTDWPGGAERPLRFLHVAGHGTLQPGLVGSKHSVILQGNTRIGEPEILRAPRVREVLINICVAGQSHDNPLDGNPAGIVPGFLRRDSDWVVASLLVLPDTWALLAGLILTNLRSTSDKELPELLEIVRLRLVQGGWPDRVSRAFSEALISALSEPRYGSSKDADGQVQQRASLLACANSDLRFARAGYPTRSRRRLEDRFAEEADQNWWMEHNPELIDNLLAVPDNAQQTLECALREAIQFAQENGTPRIPEVDTVRYGWTLFGDLNPAGEKTDG